MSSGVRKTFDEVTIKGSREKLGAQAVRVYLRDELGHVLFARGLVKPTDTSTGFAEGCLFVLSSADSPPTGTIYLNEGSHDSCNFDLMTVG